MPLERPGALAAIGGTPMVRLTKVVESGMAEVWVKLESANPTGSYKDRMALAMIEGAERAGRLRPGQTVVEYTGGSTGSSLALVCAVKGYPLRIVSATCFAQEKIRTMRAFGADVELIDSPEGITPTLALDEIDELVTVPTADAVAMARRVARREGVWSGPSTGANVVAALAATARLSSRARVVTVQVDSGLKYLSGEVYA
ncbi:MAG: PLP-dependent cysteine synthase family protein [Candidatus Limnocylindrales bacterium]